MKIPEQIIRSVSDTINAMLKTDLAMKDLFKLVDLMQARKVMEEYSEKYGSDKEDWDSSRIESEINAAQIYYDKWRETGDEIFKQLALDELEHARTIIKYAHALTQTQIQRFKQQIQLLTTKLS